MHVPVVAQKPHPAVSLQVWQVAPAASHGSLGPPPSPIGIPPSGVPPSSHHGKVPIDIAICALTRFSLWLYSASV